MKQLQSTLQHLSLQEAVHNAAPAPPLMFTVMVWRRFIFDTLQMTVAIPQVTLHETLQLMDEWADRLSANLHQLRVIPGKLFHVSQCCEPARLFLNRMLATLIGCSIKEKVKLDTEFKKDIQWFRKYLVSANWIFMMDQDVKHPMHINMDACTTLGGTLCCQRYHTQCYPCTLEPADRHCGWPQLLSHGVFRDGIHQLRGHSIRIVPPPSPTSHFSPSTKVAHAPQ